MTTSFNGSKTRSTLPAVETTGPLINNALREHMGQKRKPLEETLRRVIREEVRAG
jgi:hypothetical protein